MEPSQSLPSSKLLADLHELKKIQKPNEERVAAASATVAADNKELETAFNEKKSEDEKDDSENESDPEESVIRTVSLLPADCVASAAEFFNNLSSDRAVSIRDNYVFSGGKKRGNLAAAIIALFLEEELKKLDRSFFHSYLPIKNQKGKKTARMIETKLSHSLQF